MVPLSQRLSERCLLYKLSSVQEIEEMSEVKRQVARRIAPFGALTLALGLILGASSTNTVSARPVVEVGPNLMQSIWNQINTLKTQISSAKAQAEAYSEYMKTLDRWNDTLSNWQSKLAKFKQMTPSSLLQRDIPLQRVDVDYNVVEKCGRASTFSLSGLAAALSSKLTGATNIIEKRRDLCAAIQILENKKHNDTVDLLEETLPGMQGVLQEINSIRSLLNTEGAFNESNNNSLQSANQITLNIENFEQQSRLVDQYIGALKRQQRILTDRSLNGENSTAKLVAGTLIQAGTMAAALEPEKKQTDR